MSEFEIAIALFDFVKRLSLTEDEQKYFNCLRHEWNVLQGYEENEEAE